MNKSIVWCLVFGVVLLNLKATAQPNNLVIKFRHKVGNSVLHLLDSTYTNSFNEPFTINQFKYYVSNITVINSDGKRPTSALGTHLVNEADSATKKIMLPIITNNIVAIEFTIGVDSLKNFSGVQTDDLDPMKGMFWTWNNGYVFAKIEGQSDSSTASSNYFTYHIGGYKNEYNAVRKIRLPIKKSTKEIIIEVDILKWFNGVHPISIKQIPICHQPGKLAMQIADNYATMFTVVEKEQE